MKTLNPTKPSNPTLLKTHFLKSPPLINSTIKFKPPIHNFYSHRSLSLAISCKLKTSQEIKNNDKTISKKILLSSSAPPVSEESGADNGKVPIKAGNGGGGVLGLMKKLPRRVLAVLSNLPLAIGEMFTIAGLMALGMLTSFWCFMLFNALLKCDLVTSLWLVCG